VSWQGAKLKFSSLNYKLLVAINHLDNSIFKSAYAFTFEHDPDPYASIVYRGEWQWCNHLPSYVLPPPFCPIKHRAAIYAAHCTQPHPFHGLHTRRACDKRP